MKRVEGFPAITQEQQARLDALAALPDAEIDTSEMPEWTDDDFANAIRLNGRSLSEVVRKAPITARVDLDVIEWLKGQGQGEGYQTRLNSILRAAMLKDIRHQQHSKK